MTYNTIVRLDRGLSYESNGVKGYADAGVITVGSFEELASPQQKGSLFMGEKAYVIENGNVYDLIKYGDNAHSTYDFMLLKMPIFESYQALVTKTISIWNDMPWGGDDDILPCFTIGLEALVLENGKFKKYIVAGIDIEAVEDEDVVIWAEQKSGGASIINESMGDTINMLNSNQSGNTIYTEYTLYSYIENGHRLWTGIQPGEDVDYKEYMPGVYAVVLETVDENTKMIELIPLSYVDCGGWA